MMNYEPNPSCGRGAGCPELSYRRPCASISRLHGVRVSINQEGLGLIVLGRCMLLSLVDEKSLWPSLTKFDKYYERSNGLQKLSLTGCCTRRDSRFLGLMTIDQLEQLLSAGLSVDCPRGEMSVPYHAENACT